MGWRVCLVVLALICAVGLASPASGLVDQFESYLRRYYWDASLLDLQAIRAVLWRALNANCPNDARDCPASSVHAAIREVVRALPDGQSSFRTPEELSVLRVEQSGEPALDARFGLGLEVRSSPDGRDLVTRVLQGGPGERAGVRVGDVVLEVTHVGETGRYSALHLQNTSVVSFRLDRRGEQVNAYVTPEPGWRVAELLPEARLIESAARNILYLRLSSFRARGTAQRALDAIAKAPANSRLVVDLRYNSGGFLDEALLFLSAFMDGPVLKLRSRSAIETYLLQAGALEVSGGLETRRLVLGRPVRFEGEVLLLVNRQTASAAELLASVLQRSRRVRVIGEPSRGLAALALLPLRLADGSELRLAAVRTLFADETPVPDRLVPDLPVTDDLSQLIQGMDPVLERALER